ncbi:MULTISPECIES: hypothetical protein [unclassified Streptomyces]|uniref:hypothetical protein n=1 Tax=unclassified Streptomyces TaxID=2593676 RepID=UPI0013A6D1C3|nr:MULTISPECIES: hypothetical protein [unclassified Streptomyces]
MRERIKPSRTSRTSGIATRALACAILLAAAPLSGCTADDSDSDSRAQDVDRNTVDRELQAAIRKAGLDPAKGKTTGVPNGVPNPSSAGWVAVLATPEAERALPKIAAELERLGWHPDPDGSHPLSYEKSDWFLLGRNVTEADAVTLKPGESLLTLTATDFGP